MSSEVLKTELVKVGQDSLQAVRQSGHGWVVIKAACEVLGIDTQAQQRRLERTPWATGGMITSVGADGRTREMFCLRSDKVAMWLATIDTSRLANDEARAKLVMWQCEAADVLDRWVRGEQGVAEHKTPAALPPGWSMRKLADIMDKVCNKLREAAEQREFVSDGRLDRLCEILSATTETVEEAARRAKWKEFELENANQGLLIQLDKLNAEVEDRRQAFAMWSQSTEKVLHRLGSKQGESIEEALNRWLGEHTKNLQTNRNTLNTLQQKLASARLQTARLAAMMPAIFPDWPSVHNKTDFEWALSQVKAEIERLRSYLVKPEAE